MGDSTYEASKRHLVLAQRRPYALILRRRAHTYERSILEDVGVRCPIDFLLDCKPTPAQSPSDNSTYPLVDVNVNRRRRALLGLRQHHQADGSHEEGELPSHGVRRQSLHPNPKRMIRQVEQGGSTCKAVERW